MGFHEAISGSGWPGAKQAAATALCDRIRDCLLRTDFPADPDRVYHNLDCDPLLPDGPAPGSPASRLEFLDELLTNGPPPTAGGAKGAVTEFCHGHKREGPQDAATHGRVLGRVVAFRVFEGLYLKNGKPKSLRTKSRLKEVIEKGQLEKQQKELGSFQLADKLMWSFYDPDETNDPFRSFVRGAAHMIDRLGLGREWRNSEELVKWGHRLPGGVSAHTPTAWDGGADNPWWHPGGRTGPLSVNGDGTKDPSIRPGDGLPEVVHDPVTGHHLAIKIAFVAG